MIAQFSDPGEPILFQSKIVKLSRFNIEQRRVVILTGDHIYLFDKAALNRRHRVTNMSAIIKSTVSAEVVLVFPNAKDLRMSGLTQAQVTDLQSATQLRFCNKAPNKTLMIYGCPQRSLREYSQDNRKYGFVNLPPDEQRLRDEEIDGQDQVDQANPEDAEAEMNNIFNESILEGSGNVGRLSITNQSPGAGSEAGLDFETASQSTQSTDTTNKIRQDARGSSICGKRATAASVALEDFDIKM